MTTYTDAIASENEIIVTFYRIIMEIYSFFTVVGLGWGGCYVKQVSDIFVISRGQSEAA